MSSTHNKSTGFTLIELLVVISIIGMLSSVIMVSLQGARDKATVGAGIKFATYNFRAFSTTATIIWDFNNIASLTDSSGNNNTGTIGGTAPTVTPGPNNSSALLFNNGYVRSINPSGMPTSNSFTLSTWMYPTDACPGDCYALSIGRNVANEGAILSNRGQQVTYSLVGNLYQGASSPLVLNKWQHVAVSVSGSTAKYYVNGRLTETKSSIVPAVVSSWSTAAASIYVGMLFTGNTQAFKGGLDDVTVYTQALARDEIERIYAMGAAAHGLALED